MRTRVPQMLDPMPDHSTKIKPLDWNFPAGKQFSGADAFTSVSFDSTFSNEISFMTLGCCVNPNVLKYSAVNWHESSLGRV